MTDVRYPLSTVSGACEIIDLMEDGRFALGIRERDLYCKTWTGFPALTGQLVFWLYYPARGMPSQDVRLSFRPLRLDFMSVYYIRFG